MAARQRPPTESFHRRFEIGTPEPVHRRGSTGVIAGSALVDDEGARALWGARHVPFPGAPDRHFGHGSGGCRQDILTRVWDTGAVGERRPEPSIGRARGRRRAPCRGPKIASPCGWYMVGQS
ncbi:MAG: hypothetical protein LC808_25045 [Actinobacteria bacterium]|nr:hypothetical protein [Actinomycetota bacterium]